MRPPAAETSAPITLAFHKIERGLELGANRLSPRRFERHLRTIRSAGFASASLDALIASSQPTGNAASGGSNLERTAHLTFDDGYTGFAEAWSLCRRYGFAATIFPISGYAGRANTWDRVYPRTLHLDLSELRDLAADGVEIGAHSVDHPFLTRIAPSRARAQIRDSKSALEDSLGVAVRAFAYPFGAWSPRLADEIADAGFEIAFTLDPLRDWNSKNRFALPRTAVYGFDSDIALRSKLGAYGETARRASGWVNRVVNRCAYASRWLPRRAVTTPNDSSPESALDH